jgi:ABC-2 type transport system permease protein
MEKASAKLAQRIFVNSWIRSLAWRGDIVLFRVYDIINPLSQLLIWQAVFRTRETFGGYTKETMLTYVLISTLFIAFSRNWMTATVGDEIKRGELSQYLVKPLSYVFYSFWMGIGRTALATLLALVVILLFIPFFRNEFFVPSTTDVFFASTITLLSLVMNMLLSIAIGLGAFWTTSVDGLSDATNFIRRFFAGAFFPLDIVSPGFLAFAKFLPFPYTGYIPAQIFLGKMSVVESIEAVGIVVFWIFFLLVLIKVGWRFGVRRYEGVGI